MAIYQHVDMMDAALLWLKSNTTACSVCGTLPTNLAQATATYSLGTLAIATTVFTVGAGDVANSRKITVAAADVVLTASGTVGFVAYWNDGTYLACGTCAPTAVTSGGTVHINAYDFDQIGTIA